MTGSLEKPPSAKTAEDLVDEVPAALRRLGEDRSLYRTIFEVLPGPVFFAPPDGRRASPNLAAAELFLRDRGRAGGEVALSELPWLAAALGGFLASHASDRKEEVEAATPRGYRRFALSLRRLTGSAQELAGVLVSLDDLTERKAAEERLRLAGQLAAHGQVAKDLAHEVNNPLACIQSNLEVLRSEHETAAERFPALDLQDFAQAIDAAREGVERIALVVRDVEAALAARWQEEGARQVGDPSPGDARAPGRVPSTPENPQETP